MLVAGCRHRLRPTVGRHLNSEPLRANRSNTSYAIASSLCLLFDSIAVVRRSIIQKLVIFPAGERESNRRDADRPGIGTAGWGDRYRIEFYLCADSTVFAQMPKISGEAVGQVDGGGSELPIIEPLAFGDSCGGMGVAADKKLSMGARELGLPPYQGG